MPLVDGWHDVVRRWVLLGLAAFALNMAWELAQLPLYAGHEQLGARLLYRAGATDAAIVLGWAVAGRGAVRWSRRAAWTVLLLGLLTTAGVIELRAIIAGRWVYADAMPTVGIVGLSPLLQLPVTGALAVMLATPWHQPHGGAPRQPRHDRADGPTTPMRTAAP